jgi:class 3 adenylate cyclase
MPEERKLVTVLFADIVGSTTMAGEHDAEVVQAALDATFARIAPIVVAHGGTVEKFIGDAVMAVFGVPAAHDDDAQRAVRAAFAIRDIVSSAGGVLPLAVRVGVNTGEIVTRMDGGDQRLVTGIAVNLAQRLQSAADAGEILVGGLTESLTKGAVQYDGPRRIQAKGIGELDAYAAQTLLDVLPEQHRGVPGLRARIIGRDRELGLVRQAYDRVVAEGAPSLVTVFGPAGAGKSRLVAEFLERIGPERVRVGRCLPYGEGITFYPLQQILRADAGIDLRDDRATAREKLREAAQAAVGTDEAAVVAARLEVIAALATPDEALPSVAAADLAEELRWGFRRYIERRAAAGALVLVLEDVHWGESTFLDLVEQLAELARGPLLLVCLARPDFRELRPTFGAAAPNAQAITLAPLPPDDTRQLIAELLAIDDLSEAVRAEVVTRAEGNPLYVEEFLRMLIESGRVLQRDGRWVASGDLAALEVPPTLVGLISARLDRVRPEVKAVLQRASLVGRLFSSSALAAIGGEPAAPELLREAVRRDLLVEADERAPGEGRVHRFKHVLIRDVAYSTVPKAERARMHDRYARWLEATFGERKSEFGEIIAYHAEQAYLHAREVRAADAPALGQRALDLLFPVADRARERDDPHAALGLYRRAADIAEAVDASAAVRVRARGWATLCADWVLDPDPQRDRDLEALTVEAERLGEHRVLFYLLRRRAHEGFNRHGVDGRPIVARLPTIARVMADEHGPDLVVDAFMAVGLHAYWNSDLTAAYAAYEEAVREGRRSQSRKLVSALSTLGRELARREGRFTEAAACEREREALAPPEMSKSGHAGWNWQTAANRLFVGDFDEAARAAERCLGFARESALPWDIAFAVWMVGEIALARGSSERQELERVRSGLEEGAEIALRYHARGQIPELSSRAARACIRMGDLGAARRHVATAKAALMERDLESQCTVATAEAELASAEGDRETAERVMRETIAKLDGSGFGWDLAVLRLKYGELLAGWGRVDDAKRELARAREFFSDPLAEGWRRRIDGVLAGAVSAT